MILALVILSAVALAGLLWSEQRGLHAGVWVFKTTASTAFVALALAAGVWERGAFGQAMVTGLCLSWLGDLLLIPRGARGPFLAGLFAFLAGHVAYAAAFALRGIDVQWAAITAAGIAVPLVLVGRWLLPRVKPAMKGPVLAYMAVISVMVVLAAGTVGAHGHAGLLYAALAFYVSDIAVARQRFVAPGFVNRAFGLPAYYGAQVAFALLAAQA